MKDGKNTRLAILIEYMWDDMHTTLSATHRETPSDAPLPPVNPLVAQGHSLESDMLFG